MAGLWRLARRMLQTAGELMRPRRRLLRPGSFLMRLDNLVLLERSGLLQEDGRVLKSHDFMLRPLRRTVRLPTGNGSSLGRKVSVSDGHVHPARRTEREGQMACHRLRREPC